MKEKFCEKYFENNVKPKHLREFCQKTPEGNVIVDEKGKANGRGAYISRSLSAVDIAQKKKLFDRQLEVEVPVEIYDQLRKIIGE